MDLAKIVAKKLFINYFPSGCFSFLHSHHCPPSFILLFFHWHHSSAKLLIVLIFSPHFIKSFSHIFSQILTTIITVFNFHLSGMKATILLGRIWWERTICSSSSIVLSAHVEVDRQLWSMLCACYKCCTMPAFPVSIIASFLCKKRHEGSPELRRETEMRPLEISFALN